MKINLFKVKEILKNNYAFLRGTYHVNNIGIFGSVVRQDNKDTSDIDLLVEFSEPIGFFKFIELEEFLSKNLGRKVDLVTKKALKKTIRNDILQEVVYV